MGGWTIIARGIAESALHLSHQALIVCRTPVSAPIHERDARSQLPAVLPRDSHRFRGVAPLDPAG